VTIVVCCAFSMRGHARLDAPGAAIAYEYAGGEPNGDRDSWCAGAGAGRLCQGTLYVGDVPVAPEEARCDADRMLLAGWLAASSLKGAPNLFPRGLQELMDERGTASVRALRGDFVLAHLAADRTELRLYRGLTSMVPLFWRADGYGVRWSTDPLDLLDGDGPRLSDVALDLLPMVVAERGFPHDRSWFAGVNRLSAGSCLRLRRGCPPVVAPFDALTPAAEPPNTLQEAAGGLRERLHGACARMQRSGQEAVLMLSGGTDSAAVADELGRTQVNATGLHFTLPSFPGFADDRDAAKSVADACGLSFLPYDMSPHVARGGDYAGEDSGAGLPQTHVPLQGTAACAREAQRRGARFVFSGILSDQVMAHDWHRGMLDVAGWSILNPLVTGEPPWQALKRTVSSSFDGSQSPGVRGYLRHLRGLAGGDPALALPNRNAIVHPVGFSDAAAAQVTAALRTAAERARRQLRATVESGGRRRGIPAGTTALFQINESFNTPNLQAAMLNHFLPRHCFFTTPYADRDVIEYALSLPNAFRIGHGHGATIDKFALRVAYADSGVPPQIGRRMQQARIDAFPAVYVNQNFDRCRSLLGEDSRLREAGVLGDAFVRSMSRQSVHRNGEEIARLCVIEQWLRRIAP
jgi:hypothetical protein